MKALIPEINRVFVPMSSKLIIFEKLKLVEDCLRLTGIKNGIVVDPFMGTGTTAVAAINLDWDYIGYDIDEDYVKFATQRLNKGLTNFLS